MLEYTLLIEGVEWVIILLFMIFIVGNKRLPEISRSIGKAVGEYQRARKGLEREINRVNNTFTNIPITGPITSEREKLEIIAKALNIDPSGKTDDELRELIQNKLDKS
ncbi:MAG: hypothetical protein KatS3mg003_0637 [Candidatus Nitrosocaldaceae archaeon]|nr:MAG: hypothetical protein KatS3mg003_0637 [Candidatus Nitrosocaldaceae archaeon]